jgi:hypothetical protein
MLTHITFAISALAQATAACTRETLKAITDEHPAAQTSGQTFFASNATYTENLKNIPLASSILSKALKSIPPVLITTSSSALPLPNTSSPTPLLHTYRNANSHRQRHKPCCADGQHCDYQK